jgi:predicted nuclease with TOPRIM domain
MDKLKEEEEELFAKLIKEYSHLKPENIVNEVHVYLNENGGA